eukprot:6198082-Pleurochrysis_carterae.AAC.1
MSATSDMLRPTGLWKLRAGLAASAAILCPKRLRSRRTTPDVTRDVRSKRPGKLSHAALPRRPHRSRQAVEATQRSVAVFVPPCAARGHPMMRLLQSTCSPSWIQQLVRRSSLFQIWSLEDIL